MLEIDKRRLEGNSFPPTITLVEGLFDSLDMSLPPPTLGFGTGGSIVVLTYNDSPIDVTISTILSREQANVFLKDLPEEITEVRNPNEIVDSQVHGKLTADAMGSNAGPFWKLVYDEEKVLRALQELLPINAASTHYSIRLSTRKIPDLLVQFPSDHEHYLLPSIVLRDRFDGGWAKPESEGVDRLSSFSSGLLQEFKPIWDAWYKIAYRELSDNMDRGQPANFGDLMDRYDTNINLLEVLAALSS